MKVRSIVDPSLLIVFTCCIPELPEALLHLQRWDSYRRRSDPAVARELVSLLLSSSENSAFPAFLRSRLMFVFFSHVLRRCSAW